jgi:biofilm PGA synthesis lipoprotein PgaB
VEKTGLSNQSGILFRALRILLFLVVFLTSLLWVERKQFWEGIFPPPEDPLPAYDVAACLPLHPRSLTNRVPVIMYHDIVKERSSNSAGFDCTDKEFEQQMDWLAQQGAVPISLMQLHRHLVRGDAVPEGAVVLTFDGGYQGFYDYAYPILKRRRWHAGVFVNTSRVGSKSGGRTTMDWDTLRRLEREGLIAVGSHTRSHPDDVRALTISQQYDELARSKETLERELGHTVTFLAYPNGMNDALTRDLARKIGYTMAFATKNGLAEESPDILAVNRYEHTRLERAWEHRKTALYDAPSAFLVKEIADTPVRLEVAEYRGIKLGLVRGGVPSTIRSYSRQSVGEFVYQAQAAAGINGTFFLDAKLSGTSNTLIGPSQTGSEGMFYPETALDILPRLINRPVVVFNQKRLALFNFQPGWMNNAEAFRAVIPDYTDLFLAGAWIVHKGVARSQEEIAAFGVQDAKDPRRRAFLGITDSGEIVLGASLEVVTTRMLARAAADAGVAEAVLLDSGFSTSVVFDNRIIVTGHTAPDIPSRPVPHAIVVRGPLQLPTDLLTLDHLQSAEIAYDPLRPTQIASESDSSAVSSRRKRRSRRQRRSSDYNASTTPSVTIPDSGGSSDSGAPPEGGSDAPDAVTPDSSRD